MSEDYAQGQRGYLRISSDEVEKPKKKLSFVNGHKMIPHFNKRDKGGEDALNCRRNILVIADGVGGWNEMGVDPSLYSKALCENIPKNILNWISRRKEITQENLKNLLIKSVAQINKIKIPGSSTVCALYVDKVKKILHSANIGDSCYLIARPDAEGKFSLVFKSDEQQHSFNVPFQVGQGGDRANSALVLSHNLSINDVIVLATDGLWDNMTVEQILCVIQGNVGDKTNVQSQNIADELAKEAERLSLDEKYESPFSSNAKKHRLKYVGGKPDDISIIVSQIVEFDVVNEETDEDSVGDDDTVDNSCTDK